MSYDWDTSPFTVRSFVLSIKEEISKVVPDIVGIYLHGSLAMGGFNPNRSDIDLIVVTRNTLNNHTKKRLARIFLESSNHPYPIEISFLNETQINNWSHPCPFDFHYSEYWRIPIEEELIRDTNNIINLDFKTDPDLAAHITILNRRGICLSGSPIKEVFPEVPATDYLASILEDYQDCFDNIVDDPIYSTSNMIRVYWYLKDGTISSKKEALQWAISTFPDKYNFTLSKLNKPFQRFNNQELIVLRDYIDQMVRAYYK